MNAAFLLTTRADIDVTAAIQISGFFYVVDSKSKPLPLVVEKEKVLPVQ